MIAVHIRLARAKLVTCRCIIVSRLGARHPLTIRPAVRLVLRRTKQLKYPAIRRTQNRADRTQINKPAKLIPVRIPTRRLAITNVYTAQEITVVIIAVIALLRLRLCLGLSVRPRPGAGLFRTGNPDCLLRIRCVSITIKVKGYCLNCLRIPAAISTLGPIRPQKLAARIIIRCIRRLIIAVCICVARANLRARRGIIIGRLRSVRPRLGLILRSVKQIKSSPASVGIQLICNSA